MDWKIGHKPQFLKDNTFLSNSAINVISASASRFCREKHCMLQCNDTQQF